MKKRRAEIIDKRESRETPAATWFHMLTQFFLSQQTSLRMCEIVLFLLLTTMFFKTLLTYEWNQLNENINYQLMQIIVVDLIVDSHSQRLNERLSNETTAPTHKINERNFFFFRSFRSRSCRFLSESKYCDLLSAS